MMKENAKGFPRIAIVFVVQNGSEIVFLWVLEFSGCIIVSANKSTYKVHMNHTRG